jgi:hypothetical protein
VITKPTVLVLGAGTSIPYGYPSGAGLVKDIFQGISNTDWKEIYNAYGVTDPEMNSLKSELHLSQKPSIDAFLEHRPEFIKAGKVAMALSLLSNENPDVLNDFDIREKGVYHFLYNSLTTSWEEFTKNKLTVITFNYDRSLEYFLFSALKHSYNKSDAKIAEAMQSIPIIHVHGSLGPLTWQEPDGIDYYPLFRSGNDPREMRKRIEVASENLVIVSEAQPQSKEFTLAVKRIKEAERVYFLGFGYYSVNLERLGLLKARLIDVSLSPILLSVLNTIEIKRSYKHYRGSALGLGTAQIQSIRKKWGIALLDNKSNALEFLKEDAELS